MRNGAEYSKIVHEVSYPAQKSVVVSVVPKSIKKLVIISHKIVKSS